MAAISPPDRSSLFGVAVTFAGKKELQVNSGISINQIIIQVKCLRCSYAGNKICFKININTMQVPEEAI